MVAKRYGKAANDGGKRDRGDQAFRPGRRPGGGLLRGPRQEDAGDDQGEPAVSQVRLPRQAGDRWRRPSGTTILSSGKRTRGPRGRLIACRFAASHDLRYGMQLEILGIRPATDDDAGDGFDFFDLVPNSQYSAGRAAQEDCDQLIERYIDHPALKTLVENILERACRRCSTRMPAAQNFHHSYTSGLLEHVWSMTRIAGFLADHYAKYYDQLDPPLNRGLIVAATILHDIGKLRELEYHPVEAKYTKEGCLIGHVLMGRDMVREAAQTDRGLPRRSCSCAWNMRSWRITASASSVRRSCRRRMEALLVSYVDDLDAKMNIVARERMGSQTATRSPTGFTRSITGDSTRECRKRFLGRPPRIAAG